MPDALALRPVTGCGHWSKEKEEEEEEEEEEAVGFVDCLFLAADVDDEAVAKDASRSSSESIMTTESAGWMALFSWFESRCARSEKEEQVWLSSGQDLTGRMARQ